ncbi:hypothetical protein [Pedobacter ghigonis]|uniref:hypothetical protein n=1 Tax=Pedobacter ghigonis TaxID=2730403 RepID=UPI00158D6C2E|nr:hypothetical protein [Pedobacter ghigonis]
MDSYHYIKKIDQLFSASRRHYNTFFFDRTLEHKKRCIDIVSSQLNTYQTLNTVHNWFKDEIIEGFSSKENSYVNFCQGVLARQFKFISQFKQALKLYVENKEETDTLLKRYSGVDNRVLVDGDLLLGMQLSYIFAFSTMEGLVNEFAHSYHIQMPIKDEAFSYVQSNVFIRLNYGVNNDDAVKIIFNGLITHYIDNTFDEFEAHFKNVKQGKKIKFIGSNANLINLFFGVPFLEITGLEIFSDSKLKTIIDHFETENGSPFDYKSLESQSQKPIKAPRNFTHLKTLLLKLKGLKVK